MNDKKDRFLNHIIQYQTECNLFEQEIRKAEGVLDIDFVSKLVPSEFPLKLMAELFDLEEDALLWFCFENDFGEKGFDCRFRDETYKITCAEDFWEYEKMVQRSLLN